MKPAGALVALASLTALWGCGADDSPESGSTALDETLSVLREGQAEEACALLTERFVLDSYGAMGARGRERCVKEAGVLGTGRDVEIVEESDDQVVVEIVADDEAGFFSLIPVNGRWLVDGVAIDRTELPGPRPAVATGVAGSELEAFLKEGDAVNEVRCEELTDTGIGEWRCTLVRRTGARDGHLLEIGPDGAISGQGTAGGSGIAACCIDVQATPSG